MNDFKPTISISFHLSYTVFISFLVHCSLNIIHWIWYNSIRFASIPVFFKKKEAKKKLCLIFHSAYQFRTKKMSKKKTAKSKRDETMDEKKKENIYIQFSFEEILSGDFSLFFFVHCQSERYHHWIDYLNGTAQWNQQQNTVYCQSIFNFICCCCTEFHSNS